MAADFKDAKGSTWHIKLDGPKLKHIRDEFGINLTTSDPKQFLEIIDKPDLFFDILFFICREQLESANLDLSYTVTETIPQTVKGPATVVNGEAIEGEEIIKQITKQVTKQKTVEEEFWDRVFPQDNSDTVDRAIEALQAASVSFSPSSRRKYLNAQMNAVNQRMETAADLIEGDEEIAKAADERMKQEILSSIQQTPSTIATSTPDSSESPPTDES